MKRYLLVVIIVMLVGISVWQYSIQTTLDDVVRFMDEDTTDTHPWQPYYQCTSFAMNLQYNASLDGLKCGYVIIAYEMNGISQSHAAVMFDTIDVGVVMFEPQTDEQIHLPQSNLVTILGVEYDFISAAGWWCIVKSDDTCLYQDASVVFYGDGTYELR